MLGQYLKLAWKVLGRRKFFTFISLFGISMTLVVLMIATAVLDNFYAPRAPESIAIRPFSAATRSRSVTGAASECIKAS